MSQPSADPLAWSWTRLRGAISRAAGFAMVWAGFQTYYATERREWLTPLGRHDPMSLSEMAATFGAWFAGLFALMLAFAIAGPPILRVIMGRPTGQPRP